MRATIPAAVCFVLASSCRVVPHADPTPPPGATADIVDVALVSMVDAGHGGERPVELEPHRTVWIAGDRIARVEAASDCALPSNVRVVDGRGKFLLPGFADMHGHLPRGRDPGEFTTDESFDVLLAAGVTTMRSMRGADGDVALRDAIERGERRGPRLLLGSPGVSGQWATDAEAARELVRAYAAEGYDFLKVLGGFPLEVFRALADEADAHALPIAGHLPDAVSIEDALAAPFASIEHLHGHAGALGDDPTAFASLARRTRDAGVWVCPTLGFRVVWEGQRTLDEMLAWPGVELAHPDMVDLWTDEAVQRIDAASADPERFEANMQTRYDATRELARAGVGMLVSSSGGSFLAPGFSMFVEFDCLTEAGLEPAEILAAATINAARFVGAESEWGSVAPGKCADLVLLDGNPLEDIGNARRIAAVVRRGDIHERADLDRRLDDVVAAR